MDRKAGRSLRRSAAEGFTHSMFRASHNEQNPSWFRRKSQMSETFSVEFVGGSIHGEVIEVPIAPQSYEVTVGKGVREIYERQNDRPPFIYVQIGHAENEPWKRP